jgi:hypothetical protein
MPLAIRAVVALAPLKASAGSASNDPVYTSASLTAYVQVFGPLQLPSRQHFPPAQPK